MNAHFVFSAVEIVVTVASVWASNRLYKKIRRRCCDEGCGRLDMKRFYRIVLPVEERNLSFPIISPTSVPPKEIISWRHPVDTFRWLIFGRLLRGTPRWFIRRVKKLTFAYCPEGKKIIFVKGDTEPMSIWHARKIRRYHIEQYEELRTEHKMAIDQFVQGFNFYAPTGLANGLTDTPDLIEGIRNSVAGQVLAIVSDKK